MKKGFTLVELLAVIAIVAVLGIITVPMIMTTVEDSKKAAFTTGAQSVLGGKNLCDEDRRKWRFP